MSSTLKMIGFVPNTLSMFVLTSLLTMLQIGAPGPQLTSDLDVSLYNKLICPEAYNTSGITFTCSLSGMELHWDINSEIDHETAGWTAVVFFRSNDYCDIRREGRNILGLNIIGHQPSCNSSEKTIKSKVTVIPDPSLITSEKLNVSCFTYNDSEVNQTRVASHTIIKFSNSIPGEPQKIENGPTLMCWEAPLDSNPIDYYEIEYTTHGNSKCRREKNNRWDLPRATEISNVSIRAVDVCGHRGEAKDVTLNLSSYDPMPSPGKLVSNEVCNCDACWSRISLLVIIIGLLFIVIFGLVILLVPLLIVLYTDPDTERQGGQISIQRKMVRYFKFKAVKLSPS